MHVCCCRISWRIYYSVWPMQNCMTPLWSEEILDDGGANLVSKFGIAPQQAARRIGHMRKAFPMRPSRISTA